MRFPLTSLYSLQRECNYGPDLSRQSSEEEISRLRARVDELEEQIAGNQSTLTPTSWSIPSLPSLSRTASNGGHRLQDGISSKLFFLDADLFVGHHHRVPQIHLSLPKSISDHLKIKYDQQQHIEWLLSGYFDTVHIWMPVISKMRLTRILSRGGDTKEDTAFLLCCIDLLLHVPASGSSPENLPLYRCVKSFMLHLELERLQSLMIVQGGILLAVYELGHAIYPAAYTTIAVCARLGIALGMHNQEAPQLLQNYKYWTTWEEKIRVWWMILILDRYVSVGSDLRPLCTEDPKRNAVLPADNEAWDQGVGFSCSTAKMLLTGIEHGIPNKAILILTSGCANKWICSYGTGIQPPWSSNPTLL